MIKINPVQFPSFSTRSMRMKEPRRRWIYFLLLIFLVGLGLFVRQWHAYLPDVLNLYLGDIVWAAMMYIGFAFVFNNLEINKIVVFGLLFCYSIELSQLYHAPWIDAVRATKLGGLVLGFGFLWSDLLAYFLGILAAALAERWWLRRQIKNGKLASSILE